MKIGAGGGRGWPPWPACWRQGRRWCCWCWWWWRPRRRRRQPRPGRIVGSGWRQQRAAAVLGHGRGSLSSRLLSRSLSSSQQHQQPGALAPAAPAASAAASKDRGAAVSVLGLGWGRRGLGHAGGGPRNGGAPGLGGGLRQEFSCSRSTRTRRCSRPARAAWAWWSRRATWCGGARAPRPALYTRRGVTLVPSRSTLACTYKAHQEGRAFLLAVGEH